MRQAIAYAINRKTVIENVWFGFGKPATGPISSNFAVTGLYTPTWLKRVYTDYDYQLTNNWIQTLADPVIGVHRLYHSASIRPGTVFVNGSRWSSPRTDQLMDQATVELNPARRGALYKELQQLVVEAAPLVWVHELQFVTVYNKGFKDLIVSPLGLYAPFDRVWQDK